jgi:hypothetical protein
LKEPDQFIMGLGVVDAIGRNCGFMGDVGGWKAGCFGKDVVDCGRSQKQLTNVGRLSWVLHQAPLCDTVNQIDLNRIKYCQ